jgi:cell division protein FtsW
MSPSQGQVVSARGGYALAGHKHRADYRLLLTVSLLLIIGLIVIYAISPAMSYRLYGEYRGSYFLYRQLLHIAIALTAFAVAASVPLKTWRGWTRGFVYAAIIANALLLVPFLGVTIHGATRWLNLGPLSTFQPVELLKLAIIFLLADKLAALREPELGDKQQTTRPALVILGISGIVVVLLQKDMGSMLVISAIVCGMLFAAGVRWAHMAGLLGTLTAASLVAIIAFPYRLNRLLTFLQPGGDTQGAGYHVNQSLIGIGSGGLLGLGLGRSLQVYGYLPEAANDSIFAIFAEKFGFVGTVILLGLFGLLLQRVLSIALRAPDGYTQLVTSGILIWLASHILINVGAMIAILPLTGITLPFLSIGGSSLILLTFALGLVFQISRYAHYRISAPILAPLASRVRRAGG